MENQRNKIHNPSVLDFIVTRNFIIPLQELSHLRPGITLLLKEEIRRKMCRQKPEAICFSPPGVRGPDVKKHYCKLKIASHHIGKAAKTISQQQIINQRIYILRRLHRSNAFVRIMHYFHSRTIFNFVIGCSQTPTEIHVLRIHKNIFYQTPEVFQKFLCVLQMLLRTSNL